jgi:hypothetical protein
MASTLTALDSLVSTVDSPVRVGLEQVWQHLYTLRYTGVIVLHFQGGKPREVEIPQPVKLKLHTT